MARIRWACAAAGLLCCNGVTGAATAPAADLETSRSYVVDVWDTKDGLPENLVTSIIRTRDGYLWFGTLDGLVRFDGIRFTVFDQSNTPGLDSSRILHLFEDSQGNLWIGTETDGVALVKDGEVTPLGIGRGSSEGRLVAACEDATGAVWLCSADGQLWRYADGGFRVFLFGQDSPSAYRGIIATESGRLWAGTDRRLSALDPTAALNPLELPVVEDVPVNKLDFLLASQQGGFWCLADGHVQKWTTNRLERDLGPYPWGRTSVFAACEDGQGNLVVGTRGAGVFWFDAQGKASRLSTDQGLSYNYIFSLHVDREGSLWVGTEGRGLNRVKRQLFTVLEETRGWGVQSVCEDDQGGFGIGSNGGEVGYWRRAVLDRFGPNQGLLNFSVKVVFVDRQQRVWVGTSRGGVYQLQNLRFRPVPGPEALHGEVSAVHEDRRGQLWFGTRNGLVRWDERNWTVLTTQDGLSSDVVRAIADDAEGNLWIGTEGGGLNRLKDGKFTAYHKADGLPSESVASLYVDAEGILWMGTASGLARLREGRWTRYTKRDGLASNTVGYLIEDDQGYLWMGSYAGLMRVPKQALNAFADDDQTFIPCRTYGKAEGLPIGECTRGSQPGAGRSRQETLWFPTIAGLASVDPTQLNPNPFPPPVVIESVLIDGQELSPGGLRTRLPQSVTVPAGRERLEIHYTSLNLAAPDKARFRYRLEGHETAWNEVGSIRTAYYTKLPPDHYRFEVTACNEDGEWNPTGSSLAITIKPPFWRAWWFLSGTTGLLLGTVIAVVHYVSTQKLQRQVARLRQQEAIEKERSRIAQDIHDQLGASLTQVSLLGELVEGDKDDPAEVEAHAKQIFQTARETTRVLDEIVWAVNPSNDTLDGLVTYACKYAQEYLEVAGLRYRLDAPAQLPATVLPPEFRHNVFLAFKEAITNVVRHARASDVKVRLLLAPSAFALEVQDNGRGLAGLDEKAAQSRNGLRNMRKRMEAIGGTFAVEPAPGGGTLVRLTAPLKGG